MAKLNFTGKTLATASAAFILLGGYAAVIPADAAPDLPETRAAIKQPVTQSMPHSTTEEATLYVGPELDVTPDVEVLPKLLINGAASDRFIDLSAQARIDQDSDGKLDTIVIPSGMVPQGSYTLVVEFLTSNTEDGTMVSTAYPVPGEVIFFTPTGNPTPVTTPVDEGAVKAITMPEEVEVVAEPTQDQPATQPLVATPEETTQAESPKPAEVEISTPVAETQLTQDLEPASIPSAPTMVAADGEAVAPELSSAVTTVQETEKISSPEVEFVSATTEQSVPAVNASPTPSAAATPESSVESNFDWETKSGAVSHNKQLTAASSSSEPSSRNTLRDLGIGVMALGVIAFAIVAVTPKTAKRSKR